MAQYAYGISTYCSGREKGVWGREKNCQYVENQGTGSSYCTLHKLSNFDTNYVWSVSRKMCLSQLAYTHMVINTTFKNANDWLDLVQATKKK